MPDWTSFNQFGLVWTNLDQFKAIRTRLCKLGLPIKHYLFQYYTKTPFLYCIKIMNSCHDGWLFFCLFTFNLLTVCMSFNITCHDMNQTLAPGAQNVGCGDGNGNSTANASIDNNIERSSTEIITEITTINMTEEEYMLPLVALSDYAGYIMTPILFVTGISGNLLTVIIMVKKPFRNMSVSVVLLMLALSDLLVTFMLPFNKMFIRRMLGVDIRALTLAGCKTFYWAFK